MGDTAVGFPIFHRTPDGVIATPAGERFMVLAREINVKFEELVTLNNKYAGSGQAVAVLISPSIATGLVMDLAEQFASYELRETLIFHETQSEFVGEQVLGRVGNIGLTYLSELEIQRIQKTFKQDGLQIERLLTDEVYVLVSADHHFANCASIDVEQLNDKRLASTKTAKDNKVVGNLLIHSKFVTQFASFDIMFQAVLDLDMVGFVPKFLGNLHVVNGDLSRFRLIPLRNTEHENRTYLCLVTRKNENLRYQENIMVAFIRKYFQRLQPVF